MFKVNSKNIGTTSVTSLWYFYCSLWTYFTPFSSVFIIDFEQVNVRWTILDLAVKVNILPRKTETMYVARNLTIKIKIEIIHNKNLRTSMTEQVPLFIVRDLLVIQTYCIIFLSLFLDFVKVSMSIVSLLVQLDSGIICL